MKRHTDEEKMQIIQEAEGLHRQGIPWLKAAKQCGITAFTLASWKKKLGGNPIEPAREIVAKSNGHDSELKQLRIENQRLKMLVAEKCLDVMTLQEYTRRS